MLCLKVCLMEGKHVISMFVTKSMPKRLLLYCTSVPVQSIPLYQTSLVLHPYDYKRWRSCNSFSIIYFPPLPHNLIIKFSFAVIGCLWIYTRRSIATFYFVVLGTLATWLPEFTKVEVAYACSVSIITSYILLNKYKFWSENSSDVLQRFHKYCSDIVFNSASWKWLAEMRKYCGKEKYKHRYEWLELSQITQTFLISF